MKHLGINKAKKDSVQSYIETLYDLSDGISVIMSPNPQLQNNGIDQFTRFQY
jgi:hypothetical protein